MDKQGKRRQTWTERSARRALRAAGQDRTLRIRPDGTFELVPIIGEAPEHEQQKNDWDEVLKNAPDEKRPA